MCKYLFLQPVHSISCRTLLWYDFQKFIFFIIIVIIANLPLWYDYVQHLIACHSWNTCISSLGSLSTHTNFIMFRVIGSH